MKEYLERVRMIEKTIRKKKVKREALIDCVIPGGISYDGDRVQSSPSDRMSSVMSEVADLDKEIEILTDEKLRLIRDISLGIEKLKDEDEKLVLMSFYIGRMPMKKIADDNGYSIRTAYYLRRNGAKHFGETLHKLQK